MNPSANKTTFENEFEEYAPSMMAWLEQQLEGRQVYTPRPLDIDSIPEARAPANDNHERIHFHALSLLHGGRVMANSSGDHIVRGATFRGLRGELRFVGEDVRFCPDNGAPPMALDQPDNADETPPFDLWAQQACPALPEGLLPPVLEAFARTQADLMGVDPGAIAAATLAVCAAAIPDAIKLQVKRHDRGWTESARIWVALVGTPSAKKSPILSAASAPLGALDHAMWRKFIADQAAYDECSPARRKDKVKPTQTRLIIEDTTMEGAQEVLKASPNGVLCRQDELSGWFGSMDKYSGNRGAAKDRGFWLQSFNGGPYSFNRIGRGAGYIENLSVSMLGGIQPEPIRKLADEAVDDGLLQRLFPIVIGPARLGKDEPVGPVAARYRETIERLSIMQPAKAGLVEKVLTFSDEAQAIRNDLEARHLRMAQAWESVNKRLAAHIGKFDGLFARLCVVWQCVETGKDRPESIVSEATAQRVSAFLHDFLFPHARAFYTNVLGMSDQQDALLATAGYILANRPAELTVRTIRRGDRLMRGLKDWEAEEVLRKLDAFGWLDPVPQVRNQTALRWTVRPAVYTAFALRAEQETKRRQAIRETIAEALVPQ